jgi:cytochrome c peroxidase
MHAGIRGCALALCALLAGSVTAAPFSHVRPEGNEDAELDAKLSAALHARGFTGRIESTLEQRLGRPVDGALANLGQLLFFDVAGGLHDDNTCAGCHAPSAGMGDTQSIAIGIQSNKVVGPSRTGPRNQRRTPSVINTAFYPDLMWNGRFAAPSGDPFDNSKGYRFPLPEGTDKFPPRDPIVTHLLIAQAHIPPTELVEVAGFTGTFGTLEPLYAQFDDGFGERLPPADAAGFRNDGIRARVLARLNGAPAYRKAFGALFPAVAGGAAIDFTMFGRAVAEFEFALVRADAPIDRYARGDRDAMSAPEKRGALLFFGKAGCVSCHAVAGASNEMFSDFRMHVIGVPQIAPRFGLGLGNVEFDGPGGDEDFGLEQVTHDPADRYKFRTSPLRNAALQPAFFHNGAFTRLEDAIRHHLDPERSATTYDATVAGVAPDLQLRLGPSAPVLARLDPLLAAPLRLTEAEIYDLVAFVRDGLTDDGARPAALCQLIPTAVPSGRPLLTFEGCASAIAP